MNTLLDDDFWVNAQYEKDPSLKTLLEKRSQTQKTMKNFNLSKCDLKNINLVDHDNDGYKLVNCNLFKSDLQGSHCFNVDFSGSSLMKANFSNANLHGANFKNCNLLGTNFKNAKLENVIWDKELLQEKKANKSSNELEKKILYQEAEEIYRYLRKVTEDDGLVDTAGFFFQKEMQMRRKKMPKFSLSRIISKLVDLSCGYGENPVRIILLSIFIILIFSLSFFLSGLSYMNEKIIYSSLNVFSLNLEHYLSSLYFSVVTFTTLGYGDILPLGISRLFASLEALIGGFILAIFVVVFVKKMTR